MPSDASSIREISNRFACITQRTAAPPDDDTWLNSTDTSREVGLKARMSLWRWVNDPKVGFPPPILMNGRNYWRLGAIRQWRAGKTAAAAAAAAAANKK